MNKKIYFAVIAILITSALHANAMRTPTYLGSVKNDTPNTLYKIIIPDEGYEQLLPAGQTTDFTSGWLDLQRNNEVQLAIVNGEGEPVFIKNGPISTCEDWNLFSQSIAYWTKFPNLLDEEKEFKTFCFKKELWLKLTIQPNGVPVLEEDIKLTEQMAKEEAEHPEEQ